MVSGTAEGSARLERLTLQNFKSYAGTTSIGPFSGFCSVVGPNGSGKSNLMDAVSFVLGGRNGLRAAALAHLVSHNAENGSPCSVTALYRRPNGQSVSFSRSIAQASSGSYASVYSIDGETVPYSVYSSTLEVIEMVSGSHECRQEYDRLKKELELATEQSMANYNKKRGVNAEIKAVKDRRLEGEKWEKLSHQIDRLKTRHAAWKLYHMAQAQGELEKEIDTEQARFEKVKGNHDDLELKFKTARREHANATKSLLKIENECKAAEKVYNEVKPESARLSEQLMHAQRKFQTTKSSLQLADKHLNEQKESIHRYEDDLRKIEERIKTFEARIQEQEEQDAPILDKAGWKNYELLYVCILIRKN
ncbi:MAG: hypothetical protein SGCHY_000909 [Lobulomycetales sp.]